MARPRTPTAVLEARGAFKKNPARGRARENEPRPGEPLGPPPTDWVERAKHSQKHIELLRAWEEIVAQADFGVLTSSDRDYVEAAARLKYIIRFEKASSGHYAQLDKYLGKLGLNPADRSKVSGAKKQPEVADEWAEAAKRRQQSQVQ